LIKILHLNTENGWRGGENQMRLLIDGVYHLPDLENHVAALANSDCYAKFQPICPTLPLVSRFAYHIWQAKKIANYCQKNNIQILDAQTARTHSLAILVKMYMPELKLVVHRRVDNQPSKSILSRRKYFSPKVDTYIAISDAIKNILVNAGVKSEKIVVVKSAVPNTPYLNLIKKDEKLKWANQLKINADSIWLGNASAIAHQKGYDIFLKALKILTEKNAKFHCLIAGTGPQEEEIKRLCNKLGLHNQVTFIGFTKEIPSFLSALDILAVPSNNEGLGTIILEGIHAGCAVIASEVGGIPEMIQHQKTGLLIPPGSPEKLAEGILELIASPTLRNNLIANAQILAKDSFSVEAMVKGNVEVYRSLLR
jgi:glycosyltransferase involved in cell wall biosynthesis